MRLSRRDLMRAAMATGVAMAFPSWLSAAGVSTVPAWQRRLVLVELDGGNDGLNTLVPFADATYLAKRSTLRMSGTEAPIDFNGGPLRMNFNLVNSPNNVQTGRFLRFWQDGRLAIALGVGMPNQSRSHFRGMDVWNTGSTSLTTGWLQRSLLAAGSLGGGNVAHAALISRPTSNPLVGTQMNVLAMRDAESFLDQSQNMPPLALAGTDALRHVLQVRSDVATARADIQAKFAYDDDDGSITNPVFAGDSGAAMFPNTDFGRQCRSVAQLISAGVGIPIYKVRLGGFDNHSTQLAKHNDLLAELAAGVTGLTDALEQKGRLADTLIMTYSEFGRRVEENGSQGTDHGTLAPHFLISHASNFQGANRLHGTQPSLTDLDERGDLKWIDNVSIDYRRLYASALSFLGLPQTVFDATYDPLTNLLTT